MKKIILLIIVLLLFIPSLSFADFTLRLYNNSDSKMIYYFYWIDHPFSQTTPVHMAGGELGSKKDIKIGIEFKPGKYYIIWRDGDNEIVIKLIIHETVKNIIITTDNVTEMLGI